LTHFDVAVVDEITSEWAAAKAGEVKPALHLARSPNIALGRAEERARSGRTIQGNTATMV
jgi:hypothetical protein